VTAGARPLGRDAKSLVFIGVSFRESLDLKALPGDTYVSRTTVTS
jgi:hypothetical protein